MAVRKLKGSYWVDFRHRGCRYRKRSRLNSQAGAKEDEATLRGRLVRGEALDTRDAVRRDPTFSEFAAHWFDTYVRTNNKPSEVYAKQGILRRFLIPIFGSKRLSQVT